MMTIMIGFTDKINCYFAHDGTRDKDRGNNRLDGENLKESRYRWSFFGFSSVYLQLDNGTVWDLTSSGTSSLGSQVDKKKPTNCVNQSSKSVKTKKDDSLGSKFSPQLGARKKLGSSISAIKRGASALSSSVSDLSKAANASINEHFQQTKKSSVASESRTKRPSLPDFQTKFTKRLNAQFKTSKNENVGGVQKEEVPIKKANTRVDKLSVKNKLASSTKAAPNVTNLTDNDKTDKVALRKRDISKTSTTKVKDDKVPRKEIVSLPTDFIYGAPLSPQHRLVPGRSAKRDIKSDTELYGSVHLKAVLGVLRSDKTAEEKLIAIKESKDYWEQIGSVTEQIPCLRENTKMGSNVTPGGDIIRDSGSVLEVNVKPSLPPILIQSSSCDLLEETPDDKIHVTKITLSPDTSETEHCFSSIVQQVSLEVNPGFIDGLDDNDLNRPLNFKSPKNSLILNIDTDDLTLSQCSQPPKSPVTVQEWVNSIDLDGGGRIENEATQPPEHSSVSHDSGYRSHGDVIPLCPQETFMEDNLNLGAEARNIEGMVEASIPEIPSPSLRKESLSPGHHVSLADFRMKQSSFNSETSTFSTVSSLSSVESLLESRREDPEEILLALGFGSASQDPLARIPHRFLSQPSSARGVDLVTFLRQQEEEFQKQECSCLGYRGLAAISPSDNKQPSAIANKIIEKLGERTRSSGPASVPGSISSSVLSPVTARPRSFASAVIAATAFRHGKVLKRSDSILDPANREFLLKQGADNPSTKHKKVILGSHTFKFDPEGGLVQTSPENSVPASSPSTPTNETESPQARNQRLKEIFKRLHRERSLREQEENLKKQLKSNYSMVEKSEVFISDEKMHLSLQEPSESDKKNRPLLVRQLKVEDFISDESKSSNLNKTLTPDIDKGKLESKESYELEEIMVGDRGSPCNIYSPRTVEGSFSESSGFEDGHLCSPSGKFESASVEENNPETVIPPVEITSWDSTGEQTESFFITSSPPSSLNFSQRSRHSDPNISFQSLQLPNEQCSSGNSNQLSPSSSSMSRNSSSGTITDGNLSSNSSVSHFEKHNLRKGSYPQPTVRKWTPVIGAKNSKTLPRHFQWTISDSLSKKLSSSQTTLTNYEQVTDFTITTPTTIDVEDFKLVSDASCQVSLEDFDAISWRKDVNFETKQRRATWCTGSSTNSSPSLLSQNIALAKDNVVAQNQALVELQSMKLSLEQYRLQSQQLESSSLRFLRLYPLLSADQISSLESVHRLRLEIFREIGRMEELLSQHMNLVKANCPSDYHVLNFRFSHAIDQMSNLLREQDTLCKQLDEIASVSEGKRKNWEEAESKDQTVIDHMVNELSLLRQQLQIDQQVQHLKFQQLIEEVKNEILQNVKQYIRSSENYA